MDEKWIRIVFLLLTTVFTFGEVIPAAPATNIHNATIGKVVMYGFSRDKDHQDWNFISFQLEDAAGNVHAFAIPLSGGRFSDDASGVDAYISQSEANRFLSIISLSYTTGTAVTIYHNRVWYRADEVGYNLPDRIFNGTL